MSRKSKIDIINFATGEMIPDGHTVTVYAATDTNLTTPIDTQTVSNGSIQSTLLQPGTAYVATFLLDDGIRLHRASFQIGESLETSIPFPQPRFTISSSPVISEVIALTGGTVLTSNDISGQTLQTPSSFTPGSNTVFSQNYFSYTAGDGTTTKDTITLHIPAIPAGYDVWKLFFVSHVNFNIATTLGSTRVMGYQLRLYAANNIGAMNLGSHFTNIYGMDGLSNIGCNAMDSMFLTEAQTVLVNFGLDQNAVNLTTPNIATRTLIEMYPYKLYPGQVI